MMRSSYDDDDEFAPNPFRTDNDLLGLPTPQQPQPQHNTMAAPQGVMLNQPLNQPDPSSGMTGSFVPSPPSPPRQGMNYPGGMQQQQQTQYQFQQQQTQSPPRLSGNMDQGNNAANAQSTSHPFLSWASLMRCCKLDTYVLYFDMDTADITRRLKSSLTTFWQPDVFRTSVIGERSTNVDNNTLDTPPVYKGPDLYGPLWVSMTLIFLFASTSNISSYMHHRQKMKQVEELEAFEYDINHLMRAGSVVATMVGLVPTVLCLTCQCMGMSGIPWVLWICIYGYSMVPFMVASFVAWIPVEFFEWIFLGLACAASLLLVVRNLSTPLMGQDADAQGAKASPIILAILGCHVIFTLVVKVTFYK